MTDTQSTADAGREIPRVPYGFLDEVYASNRAYEATITRLEAEIERLRQEKAAMLDVLEWIDSVCEGTPKQPFLEITQRIRAVLAEVKPLRSVDT